MRQGDQNLSKPVKPHEPMISKLGMQHWILENYSIPSNDDLRSTLDLCREGQIWFLMHLYGIMLKWWITQNY